MERISRLRDAVAAHRRADDAASIIDEILGLAHGSPTELLKRRTELDEAMATLLLAAEQMRGAVHRFHDLEPLPMIGDIIARKPTG